MMLRFSLGKVYGMSDMLLLFQNIHKAESSLSGSADVPLWSQHNFSPLSIKLYQPGSVDPWLSILYLIKYIKYYNYIYSLFAYKIWCFYYNYTKSFWILKTYLFFNVCGVCVCTHTCACTRVWCMHGCIQLHAHKRQERVSSVILCLYQYCLEMRALTELEVHHLGWSCWGAGS